MVLVIIFAVLLFATGLVSLSLGGVALLNEEKDGKDGPVLVGFVLLGAACVLAMLASGACNVPR